MTHGTAVSCYTGEGTETQQKDRDRKSENVWRIRSKNNVKKTEKNLVCLNIHTQT